jgi:hypothetical protein
VRVVRAGGKKRRGFLLSFLVDVLRWQSFGAVATSANFPQWGDEMAYLFIEVVHFPYENIHQHKFDHGNDFVSNFWNLLNVSAPAT